MTPPPVRSTIDCAACKGKGKYLCCYDTQVEPAGQLICPVDNGNREEIDRVEGAAGKAGGKCDLYLCLTPGAETQTNDETQCRVYAMEGGPCRWVEEQRVCHIYDLDNKPAEVKAAHYDCLKLFYRSK